MTSVGKRGLMREGGISNSIGSLNKAEGRLKKGPIVLSRGIKMEIFLFPSRHGPDCPQLSDDQQ